MGSIIPKIPCCAVRQDCKHKTTLVKSEGHNILLTDTGKLNVQNKSNGDPHIRCHDPNDPEVSTPNPTSTYMLLMTAQKHKIWLADTPTHQRIHSYTIKGNEILLLDKSPECPDGKIQITTADKSMQIVMDMVEKKILISNLQGSIKLYSKENIELHAEKEIMLLANDGVNHTALSPVSDDAVPTPIAPTLKHDPVIEDVDEYC